MGYEIHVFSGRTFNFLELSETWLKNKSVNFTSLTLRDLNDFRSDVIVKKEMFEKLGKKEVSLAIDDKEALRKLWKDCDIKVVLDPAELEFKDLENILSQLKI
jgi:hypothetical protein